MGASLVEAARVSSTQKLQALSAQLADFQKRCTALDTQHEHGEGEKLELQERVNSGQQREKRLESRIQCLESETEERHQNSERVLANQREELWTWEEKKKKEIDDVREEAAKLRIALEDERNRSQEQQRLAKRREEDIIGDLEARVKLTLQAKEETVVELRKQCTASENKVREFEYLLARQREELLSGITQDVRTSAR